MNLLYDQVNRLWIVCAIHVFLILQHISINAVSTAGRLPQACLEAFDVSCTITKKGTK
ncbi:hypothetical protein M430DRAFT_37557 [Amorphotheca resinae ATCC 22711]|uniref:Uncharacterized protein n=1 Tax=Amorphotheca resinae ATCC 22711 TaxID=857342 RepID=A0A2T3ARD6_AMORE|nr:hypothetical protein M430DRAFT_37557 [Amorphotheca resinae ATCC 22711]PSS08831.1 hypothetical protein M430DRAFT_37557 [Amorphotheca resinae ATCC 22711]